MSDQCLDVVLHHRSQRVCCPVAVGDPVAQLRNPDEVMAPEVFPVILGNVDCHLSAGEVEDALLRLGCEELHVVRWCDLSEDIGIVQNLLVEDIGILARPLMNLSVLLSLSWTQLILPADRLRCQTTLYQLRAQGR